MRNPFSSFPGLQRRGCSKVRSSVTCNAEEVIVFRMDSSYITFSHKGQQQHGNVPVETQRRICIPQYRINTERQPEERSDYLFKTHPTFQ
ncbi:hypothetical protein MHYP_G00149010 [Metynnis hypsauchen]